MVVVLAVEYLDDTIHMPIEAAQLMELPVLGTTVIHRNGKGRRNYTQQLVAYQKPKSSEAEEYRALRTKLLFATEQNESRSFIITSAGPEEGKTVVVSNLAVAMAAANMRGTAH